MKKYVNGRLVDMSEREIAEIATFRERAAVKQRERETKEAETKRREQALSELIDAHLAKR